MKQQTHPLNPSSTLNKEAIIRDKIAVKIDIYNETNNKEIVNVSSFPSNQDSITKELIIQWLEDAILEVKQNL